MVVVKETLIDTRQLMNVLLVVVLIREWSTQTVCAHKHAVTIMYSVKDNAPLVVIVLKELYWMKPKMSVFP